MSGCGDPGAGWAVLALAMFVAAALSYVWSKPAPPPLVDRSPGLCFFDEED